MANFHRAAASDKRIGLIGMLALAGALCPQSSAYAEATSRAAQNGSQNAEVSAFSARLGAAYRELEARKMPVIVAVTHAGGPPDIREFGTPARDGTKAASTLIDVNSITKTVTAVMVAALVERGQLRFGERLADLFTNVPADKASITIHQLLIHAAGLPESVGEDAECLSKVDFLNRVWRRRLIASPGESYHYSNVGYGVLAAIIEARTGKSYERFLRDDVLAGLAIKDTGYSAVYDGRRSLRTARQEDIERASWGGHAPAWNLIGNGGLVSTVTDMIRFRQAVVAGEIISDEMRALVETPHIEEDGGQSWYGYGVVVQDVPGLGRVIGHDGGNGVFSAQWADYVDQGDLIFTAAADSRRGDAIEAMQVLATHLYGDLSE